MDTAFVVFTSVLEFLINAVYMGRVPLAEQRVNLKPSTVRTTGASKITSGGSKKKTRKKEN